MDYRVLESLRQTFDAPETGEVEAVDVTSETFSAEDDAKAAAIDLGPFPLTELILKDPVRLDRMIREPENQIQMLPRLLATSLVAFVIFGIAMTLVLSAAGVWPHLTAIERSLASSHPWLLEFEQHDTATFWTPWLNGDAFRLIAAYAIGLIAATGICLPSLYFYGLLAGVRMTMLDVVTHAVKSKAVAAITLIGIIPIYAALGLAIAIFSLPVLSRDAVLLLGLLLPFIAGLSGTYSLYRGLSTMSDTMKPEQKQHRKCFLQRLVLSWCAVYSAVSPVLIFTLWQRLQG
eukprot:TRINITY_DN822_c0_g1_i2.p1 TRINITY_DN822_c0_g1~~TRINITY_DN822_c0_g1_i2.p1  ORF type:complete len:290 (-),score=57.16 TRINITY_DN822_c0_g1_i2:1445-2314(-)